jgi:outer membrane protein
MTKPATKRMIRASALAAVIGIGLFAQEPAPPGLTLRGAVEQALKNYPSLQVGQAQIEAASARIRLARTAFLPRIDTLGQVNRATRNNVFGMLLPQSVVPSMSGPVIGSNSFGTVWGSALGALASWEPFDFGEREANVNVAKAGRTQSEATLKRTQFDVAMSTLDACITLIAAQETVGAAEAGVERAEVVFRSTNALVGAELRPGADASRTQAELAAARTQLIQARQAVAIARATISQFIGANNPEAVAVSAPRLLQMPPEQTVQPLDASQNPSAIEQRAVIEETQAQLRALERSYFPRFSAQAAAYARGTGAGTDGARFGGFNGLAPTVQDVAVGFTVTFPVFDLAAIRAREAEQSAVIRAENARLRQIATDLRAEWNRAVAVLEASQRVAANTPLQVSAARAAAQQASARYESGLGAIDEVAEAQRLLTAAEIDDALARLEVWRGLLEIAAAAGDLQPFLAEAGS